MPELWIGCSGFNYDHWKETFYPKEVPQRKWLEFYARHFRTVELNVTFYRLPKESSFDHWYEVTPPGFAFTVKGSRYITHIKRLVDPHEPLERFYAGPPLLRDKLAVILWQFPPSFALDSGRLTNFVGELTRRGGRHAFEFRHESWITSTIVDLCRNNNIALCMAEWPPFNFDLPLTADFVYVRRHGHGGDRFGRFPEEYVRKDADRVREYLRKGKDVFFYFNNDAAGSAIENARELISFTS